MILDNDQIKTTMDQILKLGSKNKSVEEELLFKAVGDLIVNFLQNLNDIAYVEVCKEQRESQQ